MQYFMLEAQTDAQFEIIENLARRIWPEHYTKIIGEAQVEYMVNKFQTAKVMKRQAEEEGYKYFLLYIEGVPAAYCAIVLREYGAFLSKLYVDSTVRGKGFGKLFLKESLSRFQLGTADEVRLTVNKYNATAIAAYTRWGFSVIEEVVADIGGGYVMDDFVMVCKAQALLG